MSTMLHDLNFSSMQQKLTSLNGKSFFSIQEATEVPYNLKQVSQGDKMCSPSIIHINKNQDSNRKDNLEETPQVLISGEIHGDERVVSQYVLNIILAYLCI